MKTNALKILLLEDSTADAEMIERLLKRNDVDCLFKVMMTKAAYELALDEFKPDLILSDNAMPQFTATEALEILQQRMLHIPFILVTGTVSEEFAAGIIKAGAADYLLKDRLTRLPAAIESALKITQAEKEKLASEEKLNRSEKRFRALVENNMGIISLVDENLITTFRSSSATAITGWTNAEFEKVDTKEYIHPGDIEMMQVIMDKALANPGKVFPVLLRVKHKNGHYIWLQGVINNMKHDPNVGGIITNLSDVTQRVEAEKKIIKVNRLYYFISQINQMIVRTTNEATLFAEACRIAVDLGNFKMAWIGIVDETTQQVVPKMYAGEEKEYLTKIKIISVAGIAEGREPAGSAIRQGKYVICNDIEKDMQTAPWKAAALERGYHSTMAIPVKKFGKVIGAFSFYAGEKNFFDAEEILLLEEATGDVGFALELFDKEVLRKKADEMVAASEDRYHTLTETAPVGIFHTDADGNTTYVNPCWCQISGLSYKEALGNGWLNAVYKEDKEALIKGWHNATTASEISLSQYRFVHPGGSFVWVIGQAIPERNAEKKIVGYVGTITNVTSLKIAEGLILKEKQLSETLINNLPGIFYLYDTTGKFIRWNRNFENVTGYSGKEIAAMKLVDFYNEDQKEIITASIKTVFEKKSPGIEVEIFTKTNNKIPYYINSLTINFEGKECLAGMGLDLSERKKAEESMLLSNERYNLVAKATNDSIWDLNIVTNEISRTGDGFKTLFGYDNQAGINSDPAFVQLVHPEDLPAARSSMLQVFNNPGEFYWEKEYRFLKANGQYAHVYDKGFIIRDKNGKAIRMIGSTQDITRLKENEFHLIKLNKTLQTQAKALADSNAELEQFAYVASHDLQEPLRMVTSFLILLEKKYGNIIDESGKRYIHFAVDGAKRMRQIILDLLELSKVGRKEGEPETIDLNIQIKEIIGIFQKDTDDKNAVIEVGELPVIYAYKPSVRQVFQNLIGNAIKYKKNNTAAHIKITAIAVKDHWQFAVTDNGIGIEQEYFDRIFIIFQRLHNQNEFSGTGIGLAITKKIIENSGGKIWLTSEPGKGSTFYFTIKK